MSTPRIISYGKLLKVRLITKSMLRIFDSGILNAVAFMFEDDSVQFMVCSGLGRRDYTIIDDIGTIAMISDGASTINYGQSHLVLSDWEIINRRVLVEKVGCL